MNIKKYVVSIFEFDFSKKDFCAGKMELDMKESSRMVWEAEKVDKFDWLVFYLFVFLLRETGKIY